MCAHTCVRVCLSCLWLSLQSFKGALFVSAADSGSADSGSVPGPWTSHHGGPGAKALSDCPAWTCPAWTCMDLHGPGAWTWCMDLHGPGAKALSDCPAWTFSHMPSLSSQHALCSPPLPSQHAFIHSPPLLHGPCSMTWSMTWRSWHRVTGMAVQWLCQRSALHQLPPPLGLNP